jgi:hypothetical protein
MNIVDEIVLAKSRAQGESETERGRTEVQEIFAIAAKYGVTSDNLGYSDIDLWIVIIAKEYAESFAKRVMFGKCFECEYTDKHAASA